MLVPISVVPKFYVVTVDFFYSRVPPIRPKLMAERLFAYMSYYTRVGNFLQGMCCRLFSGIIFENISLLTFILFYDTVNTVANIFGG